MAEQALAEALDHLVRGIVDNPERVRVDARETPRGEVLEVRVHPSDLGRVIGRGGRTASSLRTVVSALADGGRVRVDVIDTDQHDLGDEAGSVDAEGAV
ncbi:RNA-binding protein [Leucobacter sp. VD1]|uniref:RNA-binding protein n=1 Tax=Leucobacter sp. VD1 TaxID=3080381 RepID=UPI0030177938